MKHTTHQRDISFVSLFLEREKNCKGRQKTFQAQTQGNNKGPGKILQAKQQRFFVLYEGEKSDIKAASKVPCGTLTKISNMRHLLLRVKLKNEWLSD